MEAAWNLSPNEIVPELFRDRYDEKAMVEIVREELRQYMAELKFELYFHEEIQKEITVSRQELGNYDAFESKFKQEILKGWTFTEHTIEKKRYRNKDKPRYVYEYVVNKYSSLLYKPFDKDKYIELIQDTRDSVYPNCIHNELLRIAEQAGCNKFRIDKYKGKFSNGD